MREKLYAAIGISLCVGMGVFLVAMDTGSLDANLKNSPPTGGYLIRNGDMRICQREQRKTNGIAGGLTTNVGIGLDSEAKYGKWYGGYSANAVINLDGWKVSSTNGTTMPDTVAQYSFSTDGSTDTPRIDGYAQATNYMQVINALPSTSIAVDSRVIILQAIESQDMVQYAGQDLTFSAWVWCDVSNSFSFAMTIMDATAGRSNVSLRTIQSSTWTRVTKTVTLEDAAHYGSSPNGVGLYVIFTLVCGSTYQAAGVDAWEDGAKYGISGQTNFAYAAGQKFRLTNVKLEPGSTATPYIPRPYAEEMQRNLRYFYAVDCTTNTVTGIMTGTAIGATSGRYALTLPVPMRSRPSLTSSPASDNEWWASPGGLITAFAAIAASSSTTQVYFSSTIPSTTAGYSTTMYSNCKGNYLWLSSEL